MQQMAAPASAEINMIFGQLGHFFMLLSFTAVLTAAFAYLFSSYLEKNKTNQNGPSQANAWRILGRISFGIHVLGVLGVLINLFLIILGHHFEYYYAWQHSSTDLQFKYILSSFWEGQEGSFLLWTFWHAVLGLILMFTARRWESPTMGVVSVMQVFLTSFILGIYVFGVHIGNTPFALLKDSLSTDPVFLFDDYMKYISDGTGLNALLQNYWMVIHPPTLFLGYSAVTFPFAFALAGLYKKDFTGWVKPALPWTLFAVMILGTGILMGGAWAYEALSFGGFWAWDPVENASLVPWMVLVGGLHTMLSYRSTKRALRTTFVLIGSSFLLVLFSSYLTRSGVLGDSSVHSFTESGLSVQLILFVLFFAGWAKLLLFINWKRIPRKPTEEKTGSREFWMFIGALVFLFAALQIIIVTSVPAINKLFFWINDWSGLHLKTDIPQPVDPVRFYSGVQMWVGVIIGIMMGVAQFLAYNKSRFSAVKRKLGFIALLCLLLSAVLVPVMGFDVFVVIKIKLLGQGSYRMINPEIFLLYAACFAILANCWYLLGVLGGKFKVGGASVAHFGFGMLLLGILVSNSRQEVISTNVSGIDYGADFDAAFKRDNILLYRDTPKQMGAYRVTYLGDSALGDNTWFNVRYEKYDPQKGETGRSFILRPNLTVDKKTRQFSPNPSTKHYLTKDVYTHVSSIPRKNSGAQNDQVSEHTLGIGDSLYYSRGLLIVEGPQRYAPRGDTLAAGLSIRLEQNDAILKAEPRLEVVGSSLIRVPAYVPQAGLTIVLNNILPEQEKFVLQLKDENRQDEWIIMKAIVFPFINLVWLGTVIMVFGLIISIIRRIREEKARNNHPVAS